MEDLAQDIFIILYDKPQKYEAREGVNFKSWLYPVIRNAYFGYLDRNRKLKRGGGLNPLNIDELNHDHTEEAAVTDEVIKAITHEPDFDMNMQIEFIFNILKTAEEIYIIPVLLRSQKFSYAEIGALTFTIPETVKSRAARGREHIRNYFTNHQIKDYG